MILVIDNYDSFTYNLVNLLKAITKEVIVYRNDKINISKIKAIKPSHILISPGPGRPENAGICIELIKNFYKECPILGVCLGHQAIAVAFGGRVVKAKYILHGKTSLIYHDSKTIYQDIENPFAATRYHSLIVEGNSLPSELEITSRTIEGEIMGIRHKHFPLEGVQFHPESILTSVGYQIMLNWFKAYRIVDIKE